MITSHNAINFVMAEKIKKKRNVLPIKRKYNALQKSLSGISKKSGPRNMGYQNARFQHGLQAKIKF